MPCSLGTMCGSSWTALAGCEGPLCNPHARLTREEERRVRAKSELAVVEVLVAYKAVAEIPCEGGSSTNDGSGTSATTATVRRRPSLILGRLALTFLHRELSILPSAPYCRRKQSPLSRSCCNPTDVRQPNGADTCTLASSIAPSKQHD